MARTITLSELNDIATNMELDPKTAVRPSYSGRGMYGRECVGIVLETPGQLFELGVVMGAMFEDDTADFGMPATDSMGHGTIAYFPAVQLAEE